MTTIKGGCKIYMTWIDAIKNPPEQHDSAFVDFYGTPKWQDNLYLKTSDRVLVSVVTPNGTSLTTVGALHDNQWDTDLDNIDDWGKLTVTHWMPMPEPADYHDIQKINNKITIVLLFKSGKKVKIKCDDFHLSLNALGDITKISASGVTENQTLYINVKSLDCVYRIFSDEIQEKEDKIQS